MIEVIEQQRERLVKVKEAMDTAYNDLANVRFQIAQVVAVVQKVQEELLGLQIQQEENNEVSA